MKPGATREKGAREKETLLKPVSTFHSVKTPSPFRFFYNVEETSPLPVSVRKPDPVSRSVPEISDFEFSKKALFRPYLQNV